MLLPVDNFDHLLFTTSKLVQCCKLVKNCPLLTVFKTILNLMRTGQRIFTFPQRPKGFEENWVQTISDKSFFVILRMYGSLKPWLDQTWRLGDVMLVE